MDLRRAKEAYTDLLEYKGGKTTTDFHREAELMELDFEEDQFRISWAVTKNDLFSFLDINPEDEDLEEVLRDCLAQDFSFDEFLDEILIDDRIAA